MALLGVGSDEWGLMCDVCLCTFYPKKPGKGSAHVRRRAVKLGWITGAISERSGKDICPTCPDDRWPDPVYPRPNHRTGKRKTRCETHPEEILSPGEVCADLPRLPGVP